MQGRRQLSATAGADYSPTQDRLEFGPFDDEKYVSVPLINDLLVEGTENFYLNVTSASAIDCDPLAINDDQGRANITDDESSLPSIRITDSLALEGFINTFTVSLSSTPQNTVNVSYVTESGSATSDVDFVARTGMITLTAGNPTYGLEIFLLDDMLAEPDEQFRVTLFGAVNAQLGDDTGIGTIRDDSDPNPQISISDATILEGSSGLSDLLFNVTLSQPSGKEINVNYSTIADTATSDVDYVATSGTLTFGPGDTSTNVAVQIHGDDVVESDERFVLRLADPTNATFARSDGIGTIESDDSARDIEAVSAVLRNSTTVEFVYRTDNLDDNVQIGLFTSADEFWDASDARFEGTNDFTVASSGGHDTTVELPLGRRLKLDAHHPFLVVVADPLRSVSETDEGNNVAVLGFRPDSSLVDEVMPSPHFRSDRETYNQVVLHATAGFRDASLDELTNISNPSAASVHYLIGQDGRVTQLVPESLRANHAATVLGTNRHSIGIELVDNYTGVEGSGSGHRENPNWAPEALRQKAALLVRDIGRRRGTLLVHPPFIEVGPGVAGVIAHGQVEGRTPGKDDPRIWDWCEFMTRVTGGLCTRLNSPADIFVIDPLGRRSGIDPQSGAIISEIPDVMYSGPDTEPQTLFIPIALDGLYDIQVVGKGVGPYMLEVISADEQAIAAVDLYSGVTEPGHISSYVFRKGPKDYGDAPDTTAGPAHGNYNTLTSDFGPSHTIVPGLRMGANVDGEGGNLQNSAANADDVNRALPDDEDGLSNRAADLMLTVGSVPTVNIRVTNTTGVVAALFGWIDYNANGVFDNATERASVAVPNGTNNSLVTLVFPAVPSGFTGTTYARFRLSTDSAAVHPTGSATDGEVEDYRATITARSTGTVARASMIGDGIGGGPTLAQSDEFGSSAAWLGDLDGDGIGDLAVGAHYGNSLGRYRGEVHVLFLNANGTAKSSQKIASGVAGGPTLADGDLFGSSVASLGDLDGDGVTDLAVGADHDDTGGTDRGAVYVLFMNTDGTVRSSQKIASDTSGGPALADADHLGSAVASVGDLDGDGVTDLAVGADHDDTGGPGRGAVYVLFMNTDGTVRSSHKIASGVAGGPTLADFDLFGSSVASLGDLDGDGVTDLAVGADHDDTGGTDRGAVYVLFMNTDGTVRSSQKIANDTGGGPTLANDDRFGKSVGSAGDLDGDGLTDLAVGAFLDDTGGGNRGALYVLFLSAMGTVKATSKIASGTGDGPMAFGFGSSVVSLGDLDGDGVTELAAGAEQDGSGGHRVGALHVLFLNATPFPELTIDDVSVIEGDSAETLATFTLSLSGPSWPDTWVQYQVASGSATPFDDYEPVEGTLFFDSNERFQALNVRIRPDRQWEQDETFFLRLLDVSPTVRTLDNEGMGTILNDDPRLIGDMNFSSEVNMDDIPSFVLGLNEPVAYEVAFGLPSSIHGDFDSDGDLDFDDISGFVALLESTSARGGTSTGSTVVESAYIPAVPKSNVDRRIAKSKESHDAETRSTDRGIARSQFEAVWSSELDWLRRLHTQRRHGGHA